MLRGLLRSATDLASSIKVLQTIAKEMVDRRIFFNPRSTATADHIELQYNDYLQVLRLKIPLLEQEIEYTKNKGLTPAQMADMVKLFEQADTNKTGYIDRRELKSCLYSLGEESAKVDIDRYMKDYANSGKISYTKFEDLMMTLMGLSNTKEQMRNSFEVIAQYGTNVVPINTLGKILPAVDVNFLTRDSLLVKDEGLIYEEWLSQMFSR